jgi:glucose-6-phosphate 1-epimerase
VNAHVVSGVNSLPKVVLEHGSGSRAEVYLHGAQLTSWIPAGGHEMLFLSERAEFENGKAIRGGIPVVFPQFADTGPLPKHGWLRTSTWRLRDIPSQLVSATFETEENPESLALWAHPYHVELKISLGKTFLELELGVHNPGAEAFEFTCALHSYLSVGDVRKTEIDGLNGCRYVDKVKGGVIVTEGDTVVRISSETDRVYMDAPSVLEVNDSSRETRLEIASSGFRDGVVWNPWKEGSSKIADLGKDEYLKMLCVEAARVVNEVSLLPGDNWVGVQRFEVSSSVRT